MSDSQETVIALLKRDIEQLKEHQKAQDELIHSMRGERDHALKWGITVLGGMVISLVAWIVSFARDHIK